MFFYQIFQVAPKVMVSPQDDLAKSDWSQDK
jgi:hypothetical protein